MRKTVVAGNWKMNNDLAGSVELISGIKAIMAEKPENVDVIIAPPFTSLETASELIKGTEIKLSAQNMNANASGAFTGEISADMLKSVGCEYVILGHSERRTIYGETNQIINEKLKAALAAGLKPIFCIGETLEEREGGITNDVCGTQVKEGLEGISEADFANIIVAYEPVWAIGTGKVATPEQAQAVHAFVRGLVGEIYSAAAAANVIIQYGGSVKPDNADVLLGQEDIDGALVGGACLKADSFAGIIKAG